MNPAATALAKQLRGDVREVDQLKQMSLDLIRERRFETAADLLLWWAQQTASDPHKAWALAHAGKALSRTPRRQDEAIELLEQALQLDTDRWGALDPLEQLLGDIGALQRLPAIMEAQLARLQADPQRHQELANLTQRLAAVLEDLGDRNRAITAYQNAIQLQPESILLLSKLGDLLCQRGQPGDAQVAADMYYRSAGNSRGSEEIAYLEAALDSNPHHQAALVRLEGLVGPAGRGRLLPRWRAYVADNSGPEVDKRLKWLQEARRPSGGLSTPPARSAAPPPPAAAGARTRVAAAPPRPPTASEPAPRPISSIPRPRIPREQAPAGPSYFQTEPQAKAHPRTAPPPRHSSSPVAHGMPVPMPHSVPQALGQLAYSASASSMPTPAVSTPPPVPTLTTAPPPLERETEQVREDDTFLDIPLHLAEPDPPSGIVYAATTPQTEPVGSAPPALGGTPQRQVPDPSQPPTPFATEDPADEDAELPGARFAVTELLTDDDTTARETGAPWVLEVLRLRRDCVVGVQTVRFVRRVAGEPYWIRRSRGGFTVHLRPGHLGERVSPGELQTTTPVDGSVVLHPHEELRLSTGELEHRLRLRPLHKVSTHAAGPLPFKRYGWVALSAIVLHLFGFSSLAALSSLGAHETAPPAAPEVYAEGRIAELPPPPPPEPEPEPEPELEPEPEPTPPTTTVTRRKPQRERPQPRQRRARNRASGRRQARGDAGGGSTHSGAQQLLSALTSPVAGSGESLSEVVSNIDAVRGPAGGNTFKVGGTLAALDQDGGNVRVGRSGSRRIGTLGGAAATRGVGRLKASGTPGQVRGKVRGLQAQAQVQGSLSRGQVMEVINRSLRRIQACYEQALTTKPGLAGRVTFSWTIQPNGRVRGVRQTHSTLGSPQAARCMTAVVRDMRFPTPKGGPVAITFPFVFKQAN